MPTLQANGVELHVTEQGGGSEVVVFSHSYLADHTHFRAQIDALSERYRVVAFDHRDHGKSGRATEGYRFSALVDDAVSVIEQLDAAPCHWVGLSTGGFIGTRLALHHPELLRSVVLMDTSAEAEPTLARLRYEGMFLALRLMGIGPLMPQTMKLMFGATTRADPTKARLLHHWRDRISSNDPEAAIRFGRAIFGRTSVLDQMRSVNLPALVIVGAEDRATSPEKARRIAQRIPGAQLEIVPQAGHLSTVEQPDRVTALLRDFLKSVSPPA